MSNALKFVEEKKKSWIKRTHTCRLEKFFKVIKG